MQSHVLRAQIPWFNSFYFLISFHQKEHFRAELIFGAEMIKINQSLYDFWQG